MAYTFRNQLTNDDVRVQNKARYFADYFERTHTSYGRFGYPDLENQRSLLDKIQFRLLHYGLKRSGRFNKYIEQYLAHPFLASDDRILTEKYAHHKTVLDSLRNAEYNVLTDRHSIIDKLQILIDELQQNLFEQALEGFNTILHCPEDREEHDHISLIEYYTAIITAELVFTGFPEKDTNKILERILSNEIRTSGESIVTKFPLPPELFAKRTKLPLTDYKQQVEAYIENRTLKEQFEGLQNLYKTPKAVCKAYFRINTIRSKNEIKKTYGNITVGRMLSGDLPENAHRDVKAFFTADEFALFVVAEVNANEIYTAEEFAKDAIIEQLPRFEMLFHTQLSIDFTECIREENGHFQIKNALAAKWVHTDEGSEQDQLENDLLALNSVGANEFFNLEKIYAAAVTNSSPTQRIIHCWQYFEVAYLDQGNIGDIIIELVSTILANFKISRVSWPFEVDFDNILIGNTDDGIDTEEGHLGYHELRAMVMDVQMNSAWLIEKNKLINSPYITERLRLFQHRSVSAIYDDLKKHYARLVRELYEQRNYIEHSGISHPLAVKKMILCAPAMAETFRYAIAEEMRKNQWQTLAEVLAHLAKPDAKIQQMLHDGATFADL